MGDKNSAYQKWRQKCIKCEHLALNTPEGVYCKWKCKGNAVKYVFICKGAEPFKCEHYAEWKIK